MPDTTAVTQRIAMKGVIVNDDGKVLILREAKTYDEGTNTGRYHFPGGRLNAGEPYLEGLNREIQEETGLTVQAGRPVFVGEWFPVIREVPNQIVAVFLACKTNATDVRLSEEHDAYEWVSAIDLGRYDLMPPDDEVLETFFSKPAGAWFD